MSVVHQIAENKPIIGLEDHKRKKNWKGNDLAKIIKSIIENDMDPALIFSFSKKDVELNAKSIACKYDLTTREEK